MENKHKEKYIRVTEGGRVYVKTEDLFNHDKVKGTIRNLMNSELIKKIDSSKKSKLTTSE